MELAVDGRMTVPAMTSLVPSAERRTRFLFLPRPDAMSSARIVGVRTLPDATIAAADAADSALGNIKPKSSDTEDFGFIAIVLYTDFHEGRN